MSFLINFEQMINMSANHLQQNYVLSFQEVELKLLDLIRLIALENG